MKNIKLFLLVSFTALISGFSINSYALTESQCQEWQNVSGKVMEMRQKEYPIEYILNNVEKVRSESDTDAQKLNYKRYIEMTKRAYKEPLQVSDEMKEMALYQFYYTEVEYCKKNFKSFK